MNWDRIEGNWKQLTGKVKERWGKLDRRPDRHDRGQARSARRQAAGIVWDHKDEAEEQIDRLPIATATRDDVVATSNVRH